MRRGSVQNIAVTAYWISFQPISIHRIFLSIILVKENQIVTKTQNNATEIMDSSVWKNLVSLDKLVTIQAMFKKLFL